MRILVKKLLVLVGLSALLTAPVLYAENAKPTATDPVMACQVECKKQQDATVYEGCMLNCGEKKKSQSVRKKQK